MLYFVMFQRILSAGTTSMLVQHQPSTLCAVRVIFWKESSLSKILKLMNSYLTLSYVKFNKESFKALFKALKQNLFLFSNQLMQKICKIIKKSFVNIEKYKN